MPHIAIDTNIFVHLLNPAVNYGSHIDKLLDQLIQLQYQLLVDSTRKIGNEYKQMIVPMFRNMDETSPQLPRLRFWMSLDNRHEVELVRTDNLMRQIKSIITEIDEHADRAFVYVACKKDSILVTNDDEHILSRYDQILQKTERNREENTDFIDSREACAYFLNEGES